MADALFTCITCRVAFHDAETQRGHYKSDWHRYNLKRKVAEMPPVTVENFQQRVLAQKEKIAEQEKTTSGHCQLCNKHFSSLNAYNNHIQSKKHKDIAAKDAEKEMSNVERKNKINKEKSKPPSVDSKDISITTGEVKNAHEEAIGQSESASAAASGTSQPGERKGGHSARDLVSGEEIAMDADDDNDSDSESWESFDGEGLGVEECLFCSQVAQSMEENIKHMTLRHSFFIPDLEYVSDLDGLLSYLGEKVGEGHICLWCNEKGRRFQTTQAVQRHMTDKGHCKVLHEGEALLEFADFYDYRSSYPDFEETEGGAAAPPGEGEQPMEEDEIDEDTLKGDGFELVLPSGVAVGHRSLQRYYRQNLVARRESQSRAIMPRLLAQYKALGWTGIKGEAAIQKAKDIRAFRRLRDRHYLRLGTKANKFQPHFRCQVVF